MAETNDEVRRSIRETTRFLYDSHHMTLRQWEDMVETIADNVQALYERHIIGQYNRITDMEKNMGAKFVVPLPIASETPAEFHVRVAKALEQYVNETIGQALAQFKSVTEDGER